MMSKLLDDVKVVQEVDRQRMLDLIRKIPEDVKNAYNLVKKLKVPNKVNVKGYVIDYTTPIKNIVVTGMGGSAIGGLILEEFLRDKIDIPIIVSKHYFLPKFVDENTAVFVISYSGNTEETLSSMLQAIKSKCKIFAVTSNGYVQEICTKLGIPVVLIPKGYPSRAAIAYNLVSMLGFLEHLNKIENIKEWIDDTYETLMKLKEKIDFDVPSEKNEMKRLAEKVYKKFTFIYSYWPYASVALRWKTQLNENSKVLAKNDEIPEMNHNEIMGWEGFKNDFPVHVIILRGNEESKEISARIEFFENMMHEKNVPYTEVKAEGNCRLSQIFSLIMKGDYFSYYVSLLNKVDPTPVTSISKLKKFMKEKVNKINELEKEYNKLLI